ncbi:MAG: prepilin-type N-terminal cleavage/methylation domain-containing protein [Candidatus Riflebacteria bacterium]|nr:prepilin-type N-terminal cleavage/methylation domain-containing protein [Candidatus Riflebacteria bacterium]
MKIEIVLKKGAFTILELLLVAALLSVVAAGSYAFLIKGSSEIADTKMQSAILADLQRDFVSIRRNLDFSMIITKELLNNGSGTSPRMLSPDIECIIWAP